MTKQERHKVYMRKWRAERRAIALKKEEENRAYWQCVRRIVREEIQKALEPLINNADSSTKT